MVQVSGGALARTSSVAPSIKIKSNFRGYKRVDTIFRAGLLALLFFYFEQGFPPPLFFATSFSRFFLVSKAFTPPSAHDTMAPTNLIRHSFELAAGRRGDITPMVYRRLFRQHPEAEAMFRSEGADLVKGSMLALAIDAMLDFAGDRSGHFRMIECEVASHEAYGTPRELFGEFFRTIADTLSELLGDDWSPEMEQAWRNFLGEVDQVIAQVA